MGDRYTYGYVMTAPTRKEVMVAGDRRVVSNTLICTPEGWQFQTECWEESLVGTVDNIYDEHSFVLKVRIKPTVVLSERWYKKFPIHYQNHNTVM